MATYNLSVTNSNPASSSTRNVTSGDTVVITVNASGGGGSGTVSATATNCTVSPSSDSSSPFVFTVTNFTSTTYSVQTSHLGSTDTQTYSHTVSGSVSSGGATPTAPTDIVFGNDPGTASSTVSITATASGGTNGTMKVSADGTTWVANGSSFTFTRGTAKTIYARTEGTGSNSSNYTESHTVGYLTGDTSVSATNATITSAALSATTTLSNGTSGETYAVRLNDGSTNIATRTGNGDITFSSSLPSAGSTTTYEIFVRRPVSTGGDGSTFTQTNDTFTVTRSSQAAAAYGFQVFNSAGQLSIEVSDRILNEQSISVTSGSVGTNSSTNVTIEDVNDSTKMNYAIVPGSGNNSTAINYSTSGNTLTIGNTSSTLSFSFNIFAFRIG